MTVLTGFASTGRAVLPAEVQGLPPVVAFLLILGGALIVAKIVEVVLLKTAKIMIAHTDAEADEEVFNELHAPIYLTVAFAGAYLATQQLLLSEGILFYIEGGLLTLLVLVWARAVIRAGERFFEGVRGWSRFDHEFLPMFENLWTITVLIATLLALLTVWQVDITPLLASAGIAGVAIGFAAKDTVANFFGGLALYFDDTYKIGDYVVLDSGEAGTVVDVGIRSTTLQTRQDVHITVPNSMLNSSKVINESIPRNRKRIDIPVGVAYGTDIDDLEDLLLDIAKENDNVLDLPEPRALFRGFADSALNYELLCWVRDPSDVPKTTHELNRAIYTGLNDAGIEIPYPKRDVYMHNNRDAEQ